MACVENVGSQCHSLHQHLFGPDFSVGFEPLKGLGIADIFKRGSEPRSARPSRLMLCLPPFLRTSELR
jgi:hypothetical protein